MSRAHQFRIAKRVITALSTVGGVAVTALDVYKSQYKVSQATHGDMFVQPLEQVASSKHYYAPVFDSAFTAYVHKHNVTFYCDKYLQENAWAYPIIDIPNGKLSNVIMLPFKEGWSDEVPASTQVFLLNHELGHVKHHHGIKKIASLELLSGAKFGLTAYTTVTCVQTLRLAFTPAAAIAGYMAYKGLGLASRVIHSAVSRHLERQADTFAVEQICENNTHEATIEALSGAVQYFKVKQARIDKEASSANEGKSHMKSSFVSGLFASHPAPAERAAAVKATLDRITLA